MKNLKKHLKAFTLVELIIVITILAILATIAFVSFQSYVKDSRDSTRLTTLKNIESGLQAFQINTGKYPEPENYTLVQASGMNVGYQGYIGNTVTKLVKMNKTPIDPLDQTQFIYASNNNKTKYQLLTHLENKTAFIHEAYASDYSIRTPKTLGDTLGIILKQDNSIITSSIIDVVNYTGSNLKIYFDNKNIITGTGNDLKYAKMTYLAGGIKASCNDYLKNSGNSLLNYDGMYYFQDKNGNIYKNYCDMTTDSGGWTLMMKFLSTGSVLGYDSPYWLNDNSLGTLGNNPLADEDYKGKWDLISGEKLKFCMDNGGIKCVNKDYIGTLKSFTAQPTSMQIGYGHTSTSGQTNATNWITGFGFFDFGEIYCNGVHNAIRTKVRIGVNKNDLISQGCNSTDDYAWGYGMAAESGNAIQVGAGRVDSHQGFAFKGAIYIK